MSYRLKAVTIRTNNSEEGIRKIAELWEDVLTGKLPLLSDGIVPISQYSNYESDEKGDYAFTIDYESSVPAEFSKDGKAHCYLYIAIE